MKGSVTIKELTIDYLFLDLKTCDRCLGTDDVLDEVVDTLEPTLKLLGYEIKRRNIEIASIELAKEFQFVSSPTIRVNNQDIALSVEENNCESCSDIAGSKIDCRVYTYEGKQYDVPPKEMLSEAILKTILSHSESSTSEYSVPNNLKDFYENKASKESSCCNSGSCC